jgi:hypothetical protein
MREVDRERERERDNFQPVGFIPFRKATSDMFHEF